LELVIIETGFNLEKSQILKFFVEFPQEITEHLEGRGGDLIHKVGLPPI
jgi:hypothetical protein